MKECRLIFRRERVTELYEAKRGETWEEALIALGHLPDEVIIFINGISVPQDEVIDADEAEIVTTYSKG